MPGAVSSAVRALSQEPEVGLIYGDVNYIDADDNVIGKFPAAQTDYRLLRQGYVHVPQQAAFFRADLWRSLGPLTLPCTLPWTTICGFGSRGRHRLKYVPRTWGNFRLHQRAKTIMADELAGPKCCAFTIGMVDL